MYNITLLKSKQLPLEFQSNPKKFKKYHKTKYKVLNKKYSTLNNKAALFSISRHTSLTLKQILVILKLLKPDLKNFRSSRVDFKVKFDTILTKKPKDIRMGRGKGAPSERVFTLQGGKYVFGLYKLPAIESKRILFTCSKKLPGVKLINKYE
jgi:ribosomal protein L16/L10AE